MYRKNNVERFMRHLRRTLKQKLYAMAMVGLGVLAAWISGGDVTALAMMLLFAVPMFISDKNWLV